MMRQGEARLWVAFATALALAGCEEGKAPFATTKTDGAQALAASPVSVERDVEAPNVFSAQGEGLWDGRPSLGGVWVAHASVTDPERVMIRNPKNGKSVVGALFRRERDNPGPSLQVSSDAAEALGMLAGQPTELSVVALRREERPVPAEADIAAEEAVTAAEATEAAPSGIASAASAPADADAGAEPAAPAGTAAVDPAPAKTSGGLFGFLKKKPKPDPAMAAPVAAGAAAGPIEATVLDPVAASAAAALDRADGTAAAPTPAANSSAALKRAYVQIGIFSVEANADRAAGQMKSAGLTATVKADQSQGKTYWRVIVGPAASVAERDALASRVKGIGYPDAYPVSN